MAVVKADGYGHGSRARRACRSLRPVLISSGWPTSPRLSKLRAAGIDAPLLAWLHDPEGDLGPAAEAGVQLGVSTREQVERAAASGHRPLRARQGRTPGGSVATVRPRSTGGLLVEAVATAQRRGQLRLGGVFTHLSNTAPEEDGCAAGSPSSASSTSCARQVSSRESGTLPLPLPLPRPSGGTLRHGAHRHRPVRHLPGASPAGHGGTDPGDGAQRPRDQRQARTGRGRRLVRLIATAPRRATTLALVPLGYADGVPRQRGEWPRFSSARSAIAWSVGWRWIKCVVDVGDAEVEVGDRAVLFGDPVSGAPSPDEWADAAGTIGYELVTRLGRRVTRTEVPVVTRSLRLTVADPTAMEALGARIAAQASLRETRCCSPASSGRARRRSHGGSARQTDGAGNGDEPDLRAGPHACPVT